MMSPVRARNTSSLSKRSSLSLSSISESACWKGSGGDSWVVFDSESDRSALLASSVSLLMKSLKFWMLGKGALDSLFKLVAADWSLAEGDLWGGRIDKGSGNDLTGEIPSMDLLLAGNLTLLSVASESRLTPRKLSE